MEVINPGLIKTNVVGCANLGVGDPCPKYCFIKGCDLTF